jgi:SAM-dependent methyltransferase
MSDESPYDPIASMYHALWFDWYLPAALPALERLFFNKVPKGARILDVCCGSGHVTKELAKRGYQVTGVDNSKELIALARQQLPAIDFYVQDVCQLNLPGRFSAAISTFDSLNHILTVDRLQQAFAAVHQQLESGGRFVFDMNLHEAYTIDIKQWSVDIHDNSVGLVRGQYDPIERRARTELVWFARCAGDPECWRRRHSVVNQQCYGLDEILSALRAAGFQRIEATPAIDLGVGADLGYGRIFVSATVASEP